MDHQKDFDKARSLIESERKVEIRVYYNKETFSSMGPSVAAYVHLGKNPPKMMLKLGEDQDYEDLLCNMLHEYGHVIDYARYWNTDRWYLFSVYDYGTKMEGIAEYPGYIKRAILYSEYLADEVAKRLLKEYALNLDEKRLTLNQTMNVKNRKYELAKGELPTPKIWEKWEYDYLQNPRPMSRSELLNLQKI